MKNATGIETSTKICFLFIFAFSQKVTLCILQTKDLAICLKANYFPYIYNFFSH